MGSRRGRDRISQRVDWVGLVLVDTGEHREDVAVPSQRLDGRLVEEGVLVEAACGSASRQERRVKLNSSTGVSGRS